MFNNTDCVNFKNNLDKIISECQLPPVIAYYILKDSLNDLEDICEQVIEYEKNQPHQEAITQTIQLLDNEDKEKIKRGTSLNINNIADQQKS